MYDYIAGTAGVYYYHPNHAGDVATRRRGEDYSVWGRFWQRLLNRYNLSHSQRVRLFLDKRKNKKCLYTVPVLFFFAVTAREMQWAMAGAERFGFFQRRGRGWTWCSSVSFDDAISVLLTHTLF